MKPLAISSWFSTLPTAQVSAFGASNAAIKKAYNEYVKDFHEKNERAEAEMMLDCRDGFKFGCDPELFVKNPSGVYVSAEGLIPGTKAEPYKVPCGAVQVDGMAAEFNIDPARSFGEWDNNIETVLAELQKMLPEGYTLDAVPAVVFDKEVFDSSPDIAKELGCMPDFNAWTGEVNPPPMDPANPYLRTASGHIHIGWTEDASVMDPQHLMNCRDLVKQLDWFLGAWSTRHDSDPTRRSLYGRAGACRFKPYGVEYRVLSNFWIMTKTCRLAVWNRLQKAIEDMKRNAYADITSTDQHYYLQTSINQADPSGYIEKHFHYPVVSLGLAA